MPKKFSTSPGQVYSRLTVVSWVGEYSHVRCECGVSKMVRNDKLKDGTTKSCGCLAKEIAATAKKLPLRPPAREKAPTVERRLRAVHGSMMQRCYNPNNEDYCRYGARGITVTPEWHNKDAFVAAMLPLYVKGKWIERRDNTKGYYLDNVVFATPKRQGRNRSNTLFVSNGDERAPLSTAAAHWGIPYSEAYRMYRKAGGALDMSALRGASDRWKKRCYSTA